MVYTRQILVFSRPGNDELTEIIPLKEIVAVTGTEEELEVDPFNSFTKKRNEENEDEADCTLEIKTLQDGYNSGRVFKLRVISKKDQSAIIEGLTRFSAHEREKIEAKSKYKKTQDKIAAIINSSTIQMFLASLITVVRLWVCVKH
jgi:hypothetical protein